MPKKSGQQGNRSIGLDHQNGKGDKNRVTDLQSFRENYDAIDWRRPGERLIPVIHVRHVTDDDEKEFRHGL